MSKQWNDNLRQRMEQYETTAPEALFDDILSALPAETAPASSAAVLWLRRSAVAAVVVIAVATAYFTLTTPVPTHEDSIASAPITESTHTPQSTPTPESEPLLADATTSLNVVKPSIHTLVKRPNTATENATTPTIAQSLPDEKPQTENIAEQKKSDVQSAKRASDKASTPQKRSSQTPRNTLYASATPKPGKSGAISISLHAAGVAVGKNMHGSQQVFMVNSVLYGGRAENITASTDIFVEDKTKSLSSERHHRQPVRVGAMLRYNLSERWALESGLTYTKLATESSLGDKSDYYDERTTLHYLGIPLNAVFDIWQTKRFTFYLSAGGMVEKCISGSTRTDYFLDKSLIHTQRSDTNIKPLQWSANAAAGAQFNFTPFMAIYAEPSITYRLDNGTKIETLYNERPLDFNLNVGLRFTLR